MEVSKIQFYPNVTLDFFHLEEKTSNNADIFVNNFIPVLNNDSRALISFDDDNNCNGISDSALGFSFSAYREVNNSNELEYITNISNGDLSIIDYNVANQKEYKYYIFKEDDTLISATNISNVIETCWWDWFMIGMTKENENSDIYTVNADDVWSFALNVESAEMMQNFNKTEYRNLTQYPKVSQGKLNYASGSLTCLFGRIKNDLYEESTDLLDAWNTFCTNGQLKLLKDRKGHKMVVEIMSSSTKVMDITREQVNSITFNWIQVGDTDNMTILG